MSTSIDTAFIRQYERDVHDVFQTEGAYLMPGVRVKRGIVGSSTTFQKIGKGTATTKARHGTVTPMNQSHTAIQVTLSDFYAGDWVDKLDEAKANIDERMAIARGGAYALGRKVDSQILTTLDATTQAAVSITVTSYAAVRNGLTQMVGDLIRLDSFRPGKCWGILSPVGWERAMAVESFANADWVGPGGLEFTKNPPIGMATKFWMGVKWMVHSANPGVGTATSKIFVWNQDAVGYATGAFPGNFADRASQNGSSVGAEITYHGDRVAHFINHAMSGGSGMIDDTGVIEGNWDDTAALATS